MDGGFVADFITTGSLNCDRLNGGTILGQTISGGSVTGATVQSYGVHNTYTKISGGLIEIQNLGYGENYLTCYENGATLQIGGQNVAIQDEGAYISLKWIDIMRYLNNHINS